MKLSSCGAALGLVVLSCGGLLRMSYDDPPAGPLGPAVSDGTKAVNRPSKN